MHLLPFYCNLYVNSFIDCQSDQFGVEFVKAFWRNPKIGFSSNEHRAQASISLYIKKNIKKKYFLKLQYLKWM